MPTGVYKRSEETKRILSIAHKGKKLSEQHKNKISNALVSQWSKGKRKGYKHTEEWKRKIGIKSKGRVFSKETIERMSLAHKGKKCSDEAKRKMSEIKKVKYLGINNPFYGKYHTEIAKNKISKSKLIRNGRTSPKQRQQRNDSLYAWWRRKVKKIDKNICKLKDENCKGYNIVHHIKGWEKYPELRYEINNGITLCQFHHPKKREDETRMIPFLQELVIKQR
jgi:hypothetical protein